MTPSQTLYLRMREQGDKPLTLPETSKVTADDLTDAYENRMRSESEVVVQKLTPRERAGLFIVTARGVSIYPMLKAQTDAIARRACALPESRAYWNEIVYLLQLADNQ